MKNSLSPRYQYFPVVIGLLIIAIALVTFYYYQSLQYEKIRTTLIEQQRLRQIDSTHALAQHIGSSLDSIVTRIEVIAKSPYSERGDFSNEYLLKLVEEQKQGIHAIAAIDFMFITDKDGIRRIHIVPEEGKAYAGFDFASRDYIGEAKTTRRPVFSDGYVGVDGQYRIAVAYPIVARDSGDYQGVVGVSVPAVLFFEQFANVHDSEKEFATVFDNNANILANPSEDLIGKNFFGKEVQSQFTENNEKHIQDFRNLFERGQASDSVDDFGEGHRIVTREPVLVRDHAEYFISISTNSQLLYSDINPYLEGETLQGLSMLLVASAGIGTLIFFLARWNSSLNDQVTKRTKQLNESNRRLQNANEKLRISDQLQKEFINIAAHELRTPIQPLLGIAEMLDAQFVEKMKDARTEAVDLRINRQQASTDQEEIKVTRPEVEIIIRNAKRLERLSSDILEAARIESQSLRLHRERFDINKLANEAIEDIRTAMALSPTSKKITLQVKTSETEIEVNADRARLFEVINNLLRNAAKFTDNNGSITVSTRRVHLDHSDSPIIYQGDLDRTIYVELSVVDTGSGIDPEILPRMFSKFTTKSDSGTGLGLYIAKSIIEAHAGKIWAHNNENRIGASITFVIPTGIETENPGRVSGIRHRQYYHEHFKLDRPEGWNSRIGGKPYS